MASKSSIARPSQPDPAARDPKYSDVACALGKARAAGVLAVSLNYWRLNNLRGLAFATDVSDADVDDVHGWLELLAGDALEDALAEAEKAYRVECADRKTAA